MKNEKKEVESLKAQVKQIKKIRTGVRGGVWDSN